MAYLAETSHALREVVSNNETGYGMHLENSMAIGIPGLPIGDVPLDPSRHSMSDVNPMSFMGEMLETPHVTQVLPYRPMAMNVILHQDSKESQRLLSFMRPVLEYKRTLGASIMRAMNESVQPTDEVNFYIIGGTDKRSIDNVKVETIPDTTDPSKASAAITDIAKKGLTCIISDFDRLDLSRMSKTVRNNSVAIKVNHEYDLEIPAGYGPWPLGGKKDVNTNNSKKLAKTNREIASKHADIRQNLGGIGLAIVELTYTHRSDIEEIVRLSDRKLASAIRATDVR